MATVSNTFQYGVHGSRPTSGLAYGALYACSTHGLIYQTPDGGGTWVTWDDPGNDASLYKSGGTDVAVADGGTGSSTAAGAATNLGLGTGDSPQFTAVNLGHASDTTLTRVSAGVVAIEGTNIVKAGSVTSSGLTQNTAKLLGRSTASAGAIEEISVGSGLSLSAGSLTASGGAAPSCAQAFLTSDVTITSANTAVDVLSLTLAAGDWLLYGNAEITSAHTNQTQLTIALFDGTAIVANAQVVQQSGIGGVSQHASCNARITLGGSTTVKLQAFDVRGSSDGTVKATATSNGTTNKGTSLIALAVTAI